MRVNAMYPEGLTYPLTGLAGEAGEVLGDLQKVMRRKQTTSITLELVDDDLRGKITDELSDCLAYIAMAVNELGISFEQLAGFSMNKLVQRQKDGNLYNKEVER